MLTGLLDIVLKAIAIIFGYCIMIGFVLYAIVILKIIFRKPGNCNIHFDITIKTEPKKDTEQKSISSHDIGL